MMWFGERPVSTLRAHHHPTGQSQQAGDQDQAPGGWVGLAAQSRQRDGGGVVILEDGPIGKFTDIVAGDGLGAVGRGDGGAVPGGLRATAGVAAHQVAVIGQVAHRQGQVDIEAAVDVAADVEPVVVKLDVVIAQLVRPAHLLDRDAVESVGGVDGDGQRPAVAKGECLWAV